MNYISALYKKKYYYYYHYIKKIESVGGSIILFKKRRNCIKTVELHDLIMVGQVIGTTLFFVRPN